MNMAPRKAQMLFHLDTCLRNSRTEHARTAPAPEIRDRSASAASGLIAQQQLTINASLHAMFTQWCSHCSLTQLNPAFCPPHSFFPALRPPHTFLDRWRRGGSSSSSSPTGPTMLPFSCVRERNNWAIAMVSATGT